jgi:transposase-like protein
VKALLREDGDFLRSLVQMVVQELLDAEMSAALGAEKGDRPAARCRPDPAHRTPNPRPGAGVPRRRRR